MDITQAVIDAPADEIVALGDDDTVDLARLVNLGCVTLRAQGAIKMELSYEEGAEPIAADADTFRVDLAFVDGPKIIGNIADNEQPYKDGICGSIELPRIANNQLELLGDLDSGDCLRLNGVAFALYPE